MSGWQIFGVVFQGFALAVSVVAVLVARRAFHRTRRLADRVIGRANAPRCANVALRQNTAPVAMILAGPNEPGPGLVPCCRHQGHSGSHWADPADVLRAGYHSRPF